MRLRSLLASLLLAGCTGFPEEASPAETTRPDDEPAGRELSTPEGAPRATGECPRLTIARATEVTNVGDAARFTLTIENCGEAPIVTDGNGCYRETPGVTVNVGLPEGPRALLLPSSEGRAADASWDPCTGGAPQATIAAGQRVEHRYAWDGRTEPYCPERLPDQPCEGARAARAGAYEVAASFTWAEGDRFATASLVLVEPSTTRVPLILVRENYTVSRAEAELPARGEGCADFDVTREPWTATALRAPASEAAAVVLLEFPQGGFGSFGPGALALVAGQPLSLQSPFDPGRVLGVLEAREDGFYFSGQPLASGPQTMHSGYDVEWNGETYHVSEVVTAQLEGEAYLFGSADERGC